jgi:hypothetical protein
VLTVKPILLAVQLIVLILLSIGGSVEIRNSYAASRGGLTRRKRDWATSRRGSIQRKRDWIARLREGRREA